MFSIKKKVIEFIINTVAESMAKKDIRMKRGVMSVCSHSLECQKSR